VTAFIGMIVGVIVGAVVGNRIGQVRMRQRAAQVVEDMLP
jgi:uncharacterized membrane-anchored protein YhcB (DUF1043 family)